MRELNQDTGNALGPSYAKSAKNSSYNGQPVASKPWGSNKVNNRKKNLTHQNRPASGNNSFNMGVSGVRVSSARGQREFQTEERKH